MDDDGLAELAEELVGRPFPGGEFGGDGLWLWGEPESEPGAHFAPIAVHDSLYETPADGTPEFDRLEDEYLADLARRRAWAAGVLSKRWGPSQSHSFREEHARVLDNDDTVTALDYHLALFTGGEAFPAWHRGDRIVALLTGQWDKELPYVLTLAVVRERPGPMP